MTIRIAHALTVAVAALISERLSGCIINSICVQCHSQRQDRISHIQVFLRLRVLRGPSYEER